MSDLRRRLVHRIRGVRVQPRSPEPPPVADDEWSEAAAAMERDGPNVIGATGGSGTRVLARVVRRAGMYIGSDVNRSEDALDFAALSDRWVNTVAAGERPAALVEELRRLVVRQQRSRGDAARWGWKEPRSLLLLQLLVDELPGLRYLHVVRDGRDMAFSQNQVQLRKHGEAVLGSDDAAHPLRSIALWAEANERAADIGERELGDHYLRIRFEDLCAEPSLFVERVLSFFQLPLDAAAEIAAEEVDAPTTFGRWRSADPAMVEAMEERAGHALRRFGYELENM
jgi:hypothetical protein